jgi:hypothetical protein
VPGVHPVVLEVEAVQAVLKLKNLYVMISWGRTTAKPESYAIGATGGRLGGAGEGGASGTMKV